MPTYRRSRLAGGSYFFTLVTLHRQPWLCEARARAALRTAIDQVRRARPFRIDAWVLLPDHMHCVWTLPEDDADYSTRWRLVKAKVSLQLASTALWQPRFWEHTLRDERDFEAHAAYIHYNPVKHGLCVRPSDWPYSTFGRFVRNGLYPAHWAAEPASSIGHE
jgi:putative transposase